MTRDFVGYGAAPPNPHWPGEARVAVNFVINFEEGSELSHPAGDGVSETGLIESASTDAANRRDLAAESMFEYGARVGWWRLYRIFTRFGVPVTLFACARALAANPPATQPGLPDAISHKTMAAMIAPMTWAMMYGMTCLLGQRPALHKPIVTAGLKCPPEM